MSTMKYGAVAGIEKPVSRLVQGAGRARGLGEEDVFALLDACWEKGYTVYDTARVYGPTDKFLGDWIKARGLRDKVVVLAKGAHHNSERQRVTPQDIREDLDTSLRELGTDYADLYVLHRDDPSQPVGPIIETLNDLKKEGKLHAFGGSNWTHTRLAEANTYAEAHGLTPFALTNPNYSLAEQVKEPWENCISLGGSGGAEAREWYRQHQMPMFCWSSLAGGFLSGRITRENKDEMAEKMKLVAGSYYSDDNFTRLERAQELAKRKGVSVPEIALSFLFHQGLNIFALVGNASADEAQSNIDALSLELSPTEVAWLDLQ
jgi:aryl-alcohol dehydrogenase-like predicted oxidoreductase